MINLLNPYRFGGGAAAEITFVSAGTFSVAAGTASPGLPAGLAENDIMLLQIQGVGTDEIVDEGPAGWTLVDSVSTGGAVRENRCTVYWKRAGASESAPTVPDAGIFTAAIISAFRGCVEAGNPVEASQTSINVPSTVSIVATGLTTTSDGAMVAALVTHSDNVTVSGEANADLESIAEAYDVIHTNGSDQGGLWMAYGIKATAGAVGNTTATAASSEQMANIVVALTAA